MERKKLIRLAVAGIVIAGVGTGGILWWTHKQRFEDTDNAYVQADTIQVTPQVDGYVSAILVADNQAVQAGEILARIDPADVNARREQADANVLAAGAAVRSVDDKASLEVAMIAQREAAVTAAEATAERIRLDFQRNQTLAKDGWVSAQRLEEARAAQTESAAAVTQAKAALEAEKRSAAALGSNRAQMQAQVAAAQASAGKARLDTDRTVIRAPVSGVVGARSIRVGQYVRPGGAMMAVVPLDQTYILANFKETQVARLRIGQPVQIKADAFGKKTIRGKVESFSPATGSEFALIPVENAVGNFTKIAQRLPVRIAIDRASLPGGALRPGLSVKVEVDVRENTGPSFAEALPKQRIAVEPTTGGVR
jgi:membrane fusion protein (multidrug efflux system)